MEEEKPKYYDVLVSPAQVICSEYDEESVPEGTAILLTDKNRKQIYIPQLTTLKLVNNNRFR